ncbi:PH domain-containing protein [Pedobacter caeni]|uniref:PH domain-containing protein n=1 Tax=Pedobacter caeni TaxID=288992 RepID=A0A1M5EZF5_9SPHI|nr:PH domain-containing protein [Pedobacter caeni]SHF84710.1 PH domain-containing protein [Pedobacter caeni]
MTENKVFQSATGTTKVAFIAIIFTALCLFLYLMSKSIWIISSYVSLFIVFGSKVQTRYHIKGDSLIITSGFCLHQTIAINSIRELVELEKLKISYNTSDEMSISPRDQAEFIACLQKINTGIKLSPMPDSSSPLAIS